MNTVPFDAGKRLYTKLKKADLGKLDISEYNQAYLGRYMESFTFYFSMYKQLLEKALGFSNKELSELTMIDYGGGFGFLSLLAKEIGIGKVFYIDIFDTSTQDAETIAKAVGLEADAYLTGEIGTLLNYCTANSIAPDLFCSFDVLEHIYDLDDWFEQLAAFPHEFHLLFMTGANPENPLINSRLKRLQRKTELRGTKATEGHKTRDATAPYLEIRKQIIRDIGLKISEKDIHRLAAFSRGLMKPDIESLAKEYSITGEIPYKPTHPTNTCDPYTGNRTENLINLAGFRKQIRRKGLHAEYFNTRYALSQKTGVNMIKNLLNAVIRRLPKDNLRFSPAYILHVQKIIAEESEE